ncbi:hypothetical protein Tco_0560718 [Tanacetum coccineum]
MWCDDTHDVMPHVSALEGCDNHCLHTPDFVFPELSVNAVLMKAIALLGLAIRSSEGRNDETTSTKISCGKPCRTIFVALMSQASRSYSASMSSTYLLSLTVAGVVAVPASVTILYLKGSSSEEACETIEDCVQRDKHWKNPSSTISDQTIANLMAQLIGNEVVRVKIPKCMSWLDAYDEPIGDLEMMKDKDIFNKEKSGSSLDFRMDDSRLTI